MKVHIQGIDCIIPDIKNKKDALYFFKKRELQYFTRPDLPFTEDELTLANEGKLAFTKEQLAWIDTENDRIDNGCFMSINGVITYIPGSYYGYISFWTLEDGSAPEYREDDRLFFVFFEQCYFREKDILGILRGKCRRKGATSQACWLLVWVSTRNFNAKCGIVSKTGDDAKKAFTDMVVYGFKSLPFFMQPRRDGTDDPKTEMLFAKSAGRKKGTEITTRREGLNSSISWKNTALNSYDSGRITLLLGDEFGKLEEVDCYKYWQIVSQTMSTGSKKVGFAILPSTVNPPKKGGENFKRLWEDSDQYKYGKRTPTKLVQYFTDAAEGYAGCIDKFGASMVEEAAAILTDDLERIKDPEGRLEHRRMFPRNIQDMFCFQSLSCEFNATNIENVLKDLKDNPVYLRHVRLGRNGDRGDIYFADDKMGGWLMLEAPETPNLFVEQYNQREPNNTLYGIIGVDTYRSGFNSGGGSKGTVLVFKKSRIIEGVETGNYPVMLYVGRPRLVKHFADEVLKAALWYGIKCNFEMDGGTFYYDHFLAERALKFLEWTPKITKDSAISGKADWKPGAESANPFQLAKQLEVLKMYVDGTDTVGYNGNVHRIKFPSLLIQLLEYDHSNRTKSDEAIALAMALLPIIGYAQKPEVKKMAKPILQTYAVRIR